MISKRKPQTNADRIRAMGDEELAEKFAMACPVSGMPERCREYFDGDKGCKGCWLDWLKREPSRNEITGYEAYAR